MPTIHVNDPQKVTFYHIVKNASVSTSHWFRNLVGEYTKINDYMNGLHVDIDSGIFYLSEVKRDGHFTFTVVRNPWSRIYCAYKDFTESDEQIRNSLMQVNKWTDWPSFTQFVQKLDRFKVPETENWKHDKSVAVVQQCEYIDSGVDLIVKYENIEEELKQVEDIFGLDFPINIDHSCDYDYREHYTEETKQILANFFKDDIEKWNYTF